MAHLDGLRCLLALYVVVHHVMLTIYPQKYLIPIALRRWFGLIGDGRLAVDGFIVLSGYVLMLPAVNKDYRLSHGALNFYWRRARRILPTFYLAMIVSLLLDFTLLGHKTGTHWDICLPVDWQSILASLLMVQDLWREYRINHVFWSIAVEWRIYFLFPLLLLLCRKYSAAYAVAIFATVAIFLSAVVRPLLPPGHAREILAAGRTTLSFTALFAFGAGAAVVSTRGLPRWRSIILVPACIATLIVVAYLLHIHPVTKLSSSTIGALTGVCLTLWLMLWSDPASRGRRFLAWRPLPAVGIYAYSLYLMHAPILQLCWQVVIKPLHLTGLPAFGVLVIVGPTAALVACYGFFLLAEKPFLSKRQQKAAQQELPEPLVV